MKAIILVLFLFVFLAIVTAAGFLYSTQKNKSHLGASPTPASNEQSITFPKGGETLTSGKTYTLKWAGGPNPTQIFLINRDLEKEGVSVSLADRIYNIANTGSYDYVIPENIPAGNYKFEIGNIISATFRIESSKNSSASDFCKSADIKTTFTPDVGAGNVYATLTLKNVSNNSCKISANRYVSAQFSATNISTKHQGLTGPSTITLNPNSQAYSQVHYPNGPQCQGPINPQAVVFQYQISTSDSVNFINSKGSKYQTVNACNKDEGTTVLDVWSVFSKPITQ